MDTAMLLPALTTAVTVGLGCGTCCSPIISAFLSTYVVSHANGVKKGVLSFISFFLGKLISVSFLCIVAALISRQFIDASGYIGSFNLRLAAQITMSCIGLAMAAKWFFENMGKKGCKHCHGCGKSGEGKAGFWPMLARRAYLWIYALRAAFDDDRIFLHFAGHACRSHGNCIRIIQHGKPCSAACHDYRGPVKKNFKRNTAASQVVSPCLMFTIGCNAFFPYDSIAKKFWDWRG